jgi:ribosome-binding factor A
MGGKSQRQARIEGELQRVLSTLIAREVRDPRVGNVTITAVNVAPDLSVAQVYFVPFGDRHTPDEVLQGLSKAAGFLRGAAGRALQLRHAPRLEFAFDAQIERADHLTRLIDAAVKSDARDNTGESPNK